jgi:hypothetical protein
MGKATRHCSYEDKTFPAAQFDLDGEHLGHPPRHLLTGDLIDTRDGGYTPGFERVRDFDQGIAGPPAAPGSGEPDVEPPTAPESGETDG